MADDYDEILDGIFHGCALAAYLDQADFKARVEKLALEDLKRYAPIERAPRRPRRRQYAGPYRRPRPAG